MSNFLMKRNSEAGIATSEFIVILPVISLLLFALHFVNQLIDESSDLYLAAYNKASSEQGSLDGSYNDVSSDPYSSLGLTSRSDDVKISYLKSKLIRREEMSL